MRSEMAGNEATEFMERLLFERDYTSTGSNAMHKNDVAREIKEKADTYVALDFDAEFASTAASSEIEKAYELPDGTVVTIGSERFLCAEALFQPSWMGKKSFGIHDLPVSSIMKCDFDIRKELYANIVLSGGDTMFPGFAERLAKEVAMLAPATVDVKVVAPPERKYSSWIGGSILA